jgi:hypothetical protein
MSSRRTKAKAPELEQALATRLSVVTSFHALGVRDAERLQRERDDVILEALEAGHTHRQVAAATGLSVARINQIAQTLEAAR